MRTTPSASTIQALDEAPSVTRPSSSTNQASAAPAWRAACFANTLGSRAMLLMSQRPQRFSGTVTTPMPCPARACAAGQSIGLATITSDGRVGRVGKAWSREATPRVTCR